MVSVRYQHLHKAFGDGSVALQDFSLEVADGEFLTFLGPSGCGKTTTLRMTAGLETPTSGEIFFGERPVVDLPPGRRNIAMVFQSYALYPHMTVQQNLEYPLRKQGVARDERARRATALAATLQLDALLHRRPKHLSGGQQQRVALGRALIREPEVFLLDEPLSNLDAELRTQMRAELIQLHRRIGRTMIYVTHDQVEAMTMSTRIAVMSKGELQQVGTPLEIYREPRNRFVAAFVGSPAMNFVEGGIELRDGRAVFRAAGLEVALPDARSARLAGLARASGVLAGIRPEHLSLEPGSGEGRVLVVEAMGHEDIVTAETPAGRIVVRSAGTATAAAGDLVPLRVDPEKLHLFDAASGERLAC
ncbi:carbohydrate ABC transporter ATP-binding protein, CUT1 family [Tistlia consotensis]|uniref:Carbohydrate ABC transporter ATP-binding protein, CUT1 family n=1 Tax=Tistlia consotensis USBA 355 TaxID=560819 RepID=A0A1Y6C0B1_9PROT|nr:ABC transporter ATP-binding protein [Tistlia consotensis]SMF38896.1 carbohydrate ABC transporter ATP-binding protein, CUT1 family [Tistlia consotensis USBA 355]SNR36734.1 carbohydrate ABC transporter ATP-binding protein, CUT1 family [Tistlia consotensis]